MQIKIIAVGSTKWQRFIRRWGVSFLIGEDILFDTFGDPEVFLNNMRKFGVDLSKIKHIILSHDDWDHISGLWYLIGGRKDITVYICPRFKQEIKSRIASFGVKLVESNHALRIKDNVYTTGELYGKSGSRIIYEQSIIIRTNNGLALVCGCAHPGIVNIVQYAKENLHTGLYLLLGGMHLKDNTDKVNQNIIEKLRQLGIKKIMPLHCTGKSATEIMRSVFKDGFIEAREGDIIEL